MENRRRRGQGFAILLVLIIFALFTAILAGLIFGHLQPDEKMALTGWGGTLIGSLGTAVAYEWGSSKGSAMKDEIAAAGLRPPVGTTIDSTTTVTAKTESQMEGKL